MVILTVNAGSSSARIVAFRRDHKILERFAAVHYDNGEYIPQQLLSEFLTEFNITEVDAVAYRIVHGGESFTAPCLIDASVEAEIDCLSSLAPLHNPVALDWIRACSGILGPNVPRIAVFDTAFYASLPLVAATYALPRDLCKRYSLRRYGFHGIAHQAMWQRWRQLRPKIKEGGRVISLQLGAGCSITAINCGKPKDTSMGFSPLEGLVMATRSGDLDPGLITYLQREHGLKPDEIEHILNTASGLLGVSGESSDMRVLLDMDSVDAKLAVSLYCYRVNKYIGAYLAVLGGADAVIFGGGVGENSPLVRERILKDMKWCGIELDTRVNVAAVGCEARINMADSKIDVWVVPVDEAAILAQEAVVVLDKQRKDEYK
jgi:acetate kinase